MIEFGQIKKKSPYQIFLDEELSVWYLLKEYNAHKDFVLAERFIDFFQENNLLSGNFSKKRFLEKIVTYNISSYSRRFKKPAIISLLSHSYIVINEKGLPFPAERVPARAERTLISANSCYIRTRVHDFDVLCTLFGSLLGDLYASKVGPSIRFTFCQGEPNKAYLMWLHDYFAERGYCNQIKPECKNFRKFKVEIIEGVQKRTMESLESYNSQYYFKTFSYRNLNWLQEAFYVKGKKSCS